LFPRLKAAFACATLACAIFVNLATLARPADAAELLVIRSARCPYCLAWEHEIGRVYAKTPEGSRAPLRRFDIAEDRPAGLGKIDAVSVTPTFILVEQGREAGRIEGYSGARDFWLELRRLLARLHSAG
jgi:hypothetical protein